MSEKDLMNETMEGSYVISEVPTSKNTLIKLAGAGLVIAAGVGVIMYIKKKRKANQMVEVEEVHTKNSSKSEK